MLYKYQVSVAKDGYFLFRTNNFDEMEIGRVTDILLVKFPETEGFSVTLNKYPAQYESNQLTSSDINKIGYKKEVINDL